MPICFKCNTSIKPASLATNVQGQTYHPTCITCGICQTTIWGKPFKREKNGMITCEKTCVPVPAPQVLPNIAVASPRPPSANTPFTQRESRISSAKSDLSKLISQSQLFTNGSIANLNNVNLNSDKLCKLCYKSVLNKRFITYENGDILCFECNEILVNANKRPPRVPSVHLIACCICHMSIRGTFITEPSGQIVCGNCDKKEGIRCLKCNQLFKTNSSIDDKITLVTGKSYHFACFDCSQCYNNINRGSYYLNNDTGEQICLSCYDMTHLPKCTLCNNFIAADQYIIIDGKPFHSQCFRCINCSSILSTVENENGFTKDSNDQYICFNCNLVNNSVKCAKCMGLIPKDGIGGGISFGFNDYHVECFKCDQCKVNLTKMNKTYTDNNNQGLLFCERCFSENYLPKCTKCAQPIMSQSPGIRYEEKMYHKECLLCGRCKKSLADKKFYKNGNLLVCDSCF